MLNIYFWQCNNGHELYDNQSHIRYWKIHKKIHRNNIKKYNYIHVHVINALNDNKHDKTIKMYMTWSGSSAWEIKVIQIMWHRGCIYR